MNSSYKLAFWWPETRKIRTGRSADGYTFDRETTGALIRSQVDYSFADALQNQNILVMHREENDSVYRGDVRTFIQLRTSLTLLQTSPEESLVGMGNTMSDSWSDLFASDSEDSDTDQLAPSSPDPLPNSSPASTRASTPDEQLGSPHTPYRRIITYTARDKNRVERERAQLAAVAPPPVPLRRSMRLQPAVPFQPDPARGIFTIPQLRTDGNAIHPWINE